MNTPVVLCIGAGEGERGVEMKFSTQGYERERERDGSQCSARRLRAGANQGDGRVRKCAVGCGVNVGLITCKRISWILYGISLGSFVDVQENRSLFYN